MTEKYIVDFSKLGGPLYSGRSRGEAARKSLNLDQKDKEEIFIEVKIPESTYSITSSFFLGIFGKSIRSCGDVDKFFSKFSFNAPDRMIEKFISYTKRALREKTPLIGN